MDHQLELRLAADRVADVLTDVLIQMRWNLDHPYIYAHEYPQGYLPPLRFVAELRDEWRAKGEYFHAQ